VRGKPPLMQIVETAGALGDGLPSAQRRQQKGDKDGDNGDDHEELYQRKRSKRCRLGRPMFLGNQQLSRLLCGTWFLDAMESHAEKPAWQEGNLTEGRNVSPQIQGGQRLVRGRPKLGKGDLPGDVWREHTRAAGVTRLRRRAERSRFAPGVRR